MMLGNLLRIQGGYILEETERYVENCTLFIDLHDNRLDIYETGVLDLTTDGVIYILNEQKPKEIANKLCDYLTKYKSIK